MAFIPPSHANATFVVQRAGDTDPYTTSLGLLFNSGTFDTAQADSLAAAFKTAALPSLSTADTLVSIDYDYNEISGVLAYSSVQNAVGTGPPASGTMTQNVAALFVKRTALPGRKGRGRMFWPFVGDADVDAVGALSPGAVTRYTTMLTAWKTAITSNTAFDSPVLFHQTSTPAPTAITSFTVSPLVATQRRRLRR